MAHIPGTEFLMTVPRAPCRDCDKRYPACHDHCDSAEYIAYKKALETLKRGRREEACNIRTHKFGKRGQP